MIKSIFTIRKISTCLIIFLVVYSLYDVSLGFLSNDWLPVACKITKVESGSAEGYLPGANRYSWKTPIKVDAAYVDYFYEYSIEGKKYLSSRISYPNRMPQSLEFNEKHELIAYYWPRFRCFSVIDKGYRFDVGSFIWFTFVAFILFCYLVLMFRFRNYGRKRKKG